MNTLASLLALLFRTKTDQISKEHDEDLSQRVQKGVDGLKSDTLQVGSELLVPSLLQQLSRYGIHIDFPRREDLDKIKNEKTKYLNLEILYSEKPYTILHSLEAFVGQIDFDRVSHHCNEEVGILASPAATAAYLINSSTWNDEAERYLRTVLQVHNAHGAVPSAFPTCIFEISWVGHRQLL